MNSNLPLIDSGTKTIDWTIFLQHRNIRFFFVFTEPKWLPFAPDPKHNEDDRWTCDYYSNKHHQRHETCPTCAERKP